MCAQGVIQDTSAAAKFNVLFDAIVFRPFKNEVLDCVVTSVTKARRRRAGPAPPPARPPALALTPRSPPQVGFFAEAGPVQIFVSNYVRSQREQSKQGGHSVRAHFITHSLPATLLS